MPKLKLTRSSMIIFVLLVATAGWLMIADHRAQSARSSTQPTTGGL